MKLNPNQDDAYDASPIDDRLLAQALQPEPTPDDLEAKILALTDPAMLSLLDEALAPEAQSDELTRRILAATHQHMLPGTLPTAATRPAQQGSVLAKIGPSTFRYAAAAAIVLAVGLGIWLANQTPDQGQAPIAGTILTPGSTTDDLSDDATTPQWLVDAQLASNTDFFDAATEPVESALDNVAEGLNNVTISRDTLWAELDAYEQFLSDTES